jgi:hypothetical protein
MQVKCKKCGKPTWSGCGAHIEQALANVPRNQRCQCSAEAQPPKAQASSPWSFLTGKR